MPRAFPPYPHNTQMAAYFNAYIDHFGFRDRITFNTARGARRAHAGRRLGGPPQHRRDAPVRRAGRGQRPPPRAALAGPAVPGRLRRPADARPRLRRARRVRGRVGGGARHGQLRDGHRRGAQRGRRERLPGQPPRRAHRSQVRLRPADRHLQHGAAGALGGEARLLQPHRARHHRAPRGRRACPSPTTASARRIPPSASASPSASRPARCSPSRTSRGSPATGFASADGSEVVADAVIYCTGYNVSFPFLDPDVFSAVDNRVDLFHQVFPPDVPNLAFIGLVQPFGALMPVAEAQAEWVADQLAGDLPAAVRPR